MGLVQDHQVHVDVLSPVHYVIQLITQDFGGPDYYRSLRVFLPVSRKDPDVFPAEDFPEFLVL